MRKQREAGTNVQSLMDLLTGKDGATRQKARKSLVALGTPAVSSLIQALQNSRVDHVRWEAVKALGAIGHNRAIPGLVKALEDSDPDVRWVAAEALKKFKKAAWPALLRALIKDGSESVALRQGAHHIFRNQKESGFNDSLATLAKALESTTVPESAAVAASEFLKRMKTRS